MGLFGLFGPPNVEKLAARKDVSGLIKALGYQGDSEVRVLVALELGRIKDRRAIEPLIAALADKSDIVRKVSAEALGKIEDSRAVEPLIAVLGDKEGILRQAAAEALGEIKDPRAIEPLIAVLGGTDEYEVVRRVTAEALEKIGWRPDAGEAGFQYWTARQDWSECVKMGSRAVEPLIAFLGDRHRYNRGAAAKALGEIKDPRAIEQLIVALRDDEINVGYCAAEALGEIRDPRAVEPLIAVLGGKLSPSRRKAAAEALGKIKDPRAVEPLIAVLGDRVDHVRSAAANALGEIKDARAVEPLTLALKGEDEDVCEAAASALKNFDSPQAKSALARVEDVAARVITNQCLVIQLIDGRTLGDAGAGASSFQFAIQRSNANDLAEAERFYQRALSEGLDSLRQGYARASIGEIRLKANDLNGAIDQFCAVLDAPKALNESVHVAAQYLSVILREVGRGEEAGIAESLAARTTATLGYNLAPTAANHARELARKSMSKA